MVFKMVFWLCYLPLILSALLFPQCKCWDQVELDLFDLVEEIGEDFYEIMQVKQDASQAEIKRAYRRLSLQLHPDKSEDPDAAEKFRKMVAVADVLKDEEKRDVYDEILEYGLPDWKEPVFYYRKVRKMGLLEVSVMLVGVTSIGHYLYGWAVYAEKQLVLQDVLSRKQRKEQRKLKPSKAQVSQQRFQAELEIRTAEVKASAPSLRNILPILLLRHIFLFLLYLLYCLRKKCGKTTPTSSQENGKKVANGKKANTRRKHVEVDTPESGDGSDGDGGVGGDGVDGARKGKNDKHVKHKDGDQESKTVASNKVKMVATETKTAKEGSKDVTLKQDASKTSEKQGKKEVKHGKVGRAGGGTIGRENEGKSTEGKDNGVDKGLATEKGLATDVEATTVDGSPRHKAEGDGGWKLAERKSAKTKKKAKKQLTDLREVFVPKEETQAERKDKPERKEDENRREGKETIPEGRETQVEMKNEGKELIEMDKKKEDVGVEPDQKKEEKAASGLQLSPNSTAGVANSSVAEVSTSNAALALEDAMMWTQYQQKQLELALSKYPKFSQDRWFNIAKAVPEKTQEECMQRCVHLYEELKNKRTI